MKSFRKPLLLLTCFSFTVLALGLILLPKLFMSAQKIKRAELSALLGKKRFSLEELEQGIKLAICVGACFVPAVAFCQI